MPVTNLQELEELIEKTKYAQKQYAEFTQAQVDKIFKAAALAANNRRIQLAQQAFNETGMGVIEDKVIKNHFASEYIYNKYKDEKTCGIVEDDHAFGIQKIAEPLGILAGIVPTTNPTSTTIFKALIALKTRNAIIFSPHPRAKDSTIESARIVLQAAIEAGAPEGIIGWIDKPSLNLSQTLMQHKDINLILATGGPAMVRAAYSSGHPSLGVGAGNTPALIDNTADVEMAVSSILLSKTFDNGMICASEQSVIAVDTLYDRVKEEFSKRGAYFLNPEEKQKVSELILVDGHINIDIIGQQASKIAELAGFNIPEDSRILIAEVEEIGLDEPFAYEKLSPILAMYRAKDFEDGLEKTVELIDFAGRGHTSVLYTAIDNHEHIKIFESKLNTGRILINTPASQGAIGDLYNFRLDPSLTLGCGSWGGNTVSENVGVKHLINIKTVSERRENMLWFRVPPKIYFKPNSLPVALRELQGKQRAFIITDKPLFDLGMTQGIENILQEVGLKYDIFYDVEPDPSLTTVERGLAQIKQFKPDVIIAFGGGSPMDAAKVMWLMYERPDIKFDGLSMRFMDIRKRVYTVLPNGTPKAMMIAIPTTSGTGSEVTPFAVVTDNSTGIKYPLADYALTPDMAIIDPDLVLNMPKGLTAFGGIDAVTHALESFVSVYATEFTSGLSLEALEILFKYLPAAYKEGANNARAREKVHYAATLAGMAFANAFLGICHSLAHKLGSAVHLPHGLANALMISHVIRYNATDAPYKQAAFPQYHYPNAKQRYARVADYLKLGGKTDDEKIENLITAIEELKRQLDIPATIEEALEGEIEKQRFFWQELDDMAVQAFDDQCTGANPRYPLIKDLKELYISAYSADKKLAE